MVITSTKPRINMKFMSEQYNLPSSLSDESATHDVKRMSELIKKQNREICTSLRDENSRLEMKMKYLNLQINSNEEKIEKLSYEREDLLLRLQSLTVALDGMNQSLADLKKFQSLLSQETSSFGRQFDKLKNDSVFDANDDDDVSYRSSYEL